MTVWLTGLTLGLAASIHCIAMCGPLMAVVRHRLLSPATRGSAASGRTPGWMLEFMYQGARISTYCALGLAVGAMGQLVFLGGFGRWLSVGAGLLLLVMVCVPAGVRANGGARRITVLIGRGLSWTAKHALIAPRIAATGVGVLNALLPCGMVYAALTAAAATGTPARAAGLMIGFGLGTTASLVPALLAAKYVPVPHPKLRQMMRPLAFGTVGLLLIARGVLPVGIHESPDPTVHSHQQTH
jgi:uncharacterized protein